MYNKKAVFDIAIYAIPSLFLLLLVLSIFSIYFATISKEAPSIDVSKFDDKTVTLITFLRTQTDKGIIADLIRDSIEKNDFTEFDAKTKELFKDNFFYHIAIYEQKNLLHEIKNINTEPNTELILPVKDKTITIKLYLR